MKNLVISALLTDSGKTSFTLGLLQYLKDKKFDVSSFKVGPDFIDPIYHKEIVGKKSINLDSYFVDKNDLIEVFHKYSSDLNIIEGVMGHLDGLKEGRASTDDVASTLTTPVLLLIESMPSLRTIAAVIDGISRHSKSQIIGVVITKCKSQKLFEMQKQEILELTNIKHVYRFPYCEELKIPSRHLGLDLSFDEIKKVAKKASNLIEENININSIIEDLKEIKKNKKDVYYQFDKVAAITKDEAFSFIYQENIEYLKEKGYEIKYFSPLHDKTLPKADFYYITGGYPELYKKELSENKDMLKQIYEVCDSNIPVIAECGGHMYLSEYIDEYKMVGFIKGKSVFDGKLNMRFGYENIEILENCFFKKGTILKGHEFHYSHMNVDKENAIKVIKESNQKTFITGIIKNNTLSSYTHLYFKSKKDK